MQHFLTQWYLILAVLFVPAVLVTSACRARLQTRVSWWLTACYVVFSVVLVRFVYSLGRDTQVVRLSNSISDWLELHSVPIMYTVCIWLMYWLKMWLAHHTGWWGALKDDEPPKSYGFPVSPKDDNDPPPPR